MSRRIVITGLGPVSAAGIGQDAFWQSLCDGRSGLTKIDLFDPAGFPFRMGGQVRGLKVRDFVPKAYRKQTKVMARDTELAVVAARLACDDAGLVTRQTEQEGDGDAAGFTIAPSRTGCQIGAGLIACETDEMSRAMATSTDDLGHWDLQKWGAIDGGGQAMNNLPPLWLLKYLPNMLACHVTILHGLEGPSNTITCAEGSALLSIGEGARVIERGDADLCFSGGAESKLNLMGLLRMDLAGRLAHDDEESDAAKVIRPFDPASPGGLMGEGGGIMILEDRDHARNRGAKPYAEVAGFGAAHSPPPLFPGVFDEPQTDPIDLGEKRAIESALTDAGITHADIDAIVPLGIGMPGLDVAEAGALWGVFGERLESIPLITLTPNTGNTLAGQGGLMCAAAALALHHQHLPARIHTGTPQSGINAGATAARPADLSCILVCTHAMGGQSAAVVLRRAS